MIDTLKYLNQEEPFVAYRCRHDGYIDEGGLLTVYAIIQVMMLFHHL